MITTLYSHIAAAVSGLIRRVYPEHYCSLCYVHSIVGANVASLVLEREYRPVAGIALVDCGGGGFIRMTDNTAFANPAGGAFHCWIESVPAPGCEKEVVDFTFGQNKQYALKNKLRWHGPPPPKYLWGLYSEVVVPGALEDVQPGFGKNRIWLQETPQGRAWVTQNMTENMNAYVQLTAEAVKMVRRSVPPSTLLVDATLAAAPVVCKDKDAPAPQLPRL